jgi:triacylglycerol lipase
MTCIAPCGALPPAKPTQTARVGSTVVRGYVSLADQSARMNHSLLAAERAMSVTNNIDPSLALLLVDASIESYYAYDPHVPAQCKLDLVTAPAGYDVIDCWTGLDTVFSSFGLYECFGVVFRSKAAPYSYVFSFRGTYSMLDVLEDLDFWQQYPFVPWGALQSAGDAKVAGGFWSIYSASRAGSKSMQQQLFDLLDKYQASAQPISRLFVTGHSLGAALSELFTLDLALSPYREIPYRNYNYAGPLVGNPAFAQLYDSQSPELDPEMRTLRIQNTYDIVPCSPPQLFGYQHVGDAYLVAFYNKNAGWLNPEAKLYDHQAVNYRGVLSCAFSSSQGYCDNDNLVVGNETLVSRKPDPSTLCMFWPETQPPVAPVYIPSPVTEDVTPATIAEALPCPSALDESARPADQ